MNLKIEDLNHEMCIDENQAKFIYDFIKEFVCRDGIEARLIIKERGIKDRKRKEYYINFDLKKKSKKSEQKWRLKNLLFY